MRKLEVTAKNQGARAERNTAAGDFKCHPRFGSDLPRSLPAFQSSDVLLVQTRTTLLGRFALDTTINARPHVKSRTDPNALFFKSHSAGATLLD